MKNPISEYAQSDYISGKVKVDESTCTGCHQCVLICPASALEMSDRKTSSMIPGADCISCGDCTAVCHTGSIRIEKFYRIPTGFYKTAGRKQLSNGGCGFPRYFESSNLPVTKRKKK